MRFEAEDLRPIADLFKQLLREELKGLAKNQSKEDIWMNVKEVAEYLRVSTKWIYERTSTKQIPHYKPDGVLLFRKREIDKWIEDNKVALISSKYSRLNVVKDKVAS